MKNEIIISIYLDTRRVKRNGKYPVKLRVYYNPTKTTKYYPTKFEFTKSEFQSIWESKKPREEHKPIRKQIIAIETTASDALSELTAFTFDAFEKALFIKPDDKTNVLFHYDEAISKLRINEQLGTASNYKLSKRSLIEFYTHKHNKAPDVLPFTEITADWLKEYERYMKGIGRSKTTVSMYLRALRTIFNSATPKYASESIYPFYRKHRNPSGYKVPSVVKVKKAFDGSKLKILFESETSSAEQAKAKDFWFFSYVCNGMNIKDIALLKYENMNDDILVFYRAKTENTSDELIPIQVYLTSFAKGIIEKYGNPSKRPNDYIFPIISNADNAESQRTKIQNFTRFINQNFKKYALANGISDEVSTYWARHTYTSQAIRGGASMEFVSKTLGHVSIKTTQNYFDGFADETKREIAESLMNF